jgi:AraC-like DNA-binding protein
VGFQSLTQFNRTFKRVFGQSPSDFRAHLSSRKRRQSHLPADRRINEPITRTTC